MISLNATGDASPSTLAFAEEASVESYIHKIRIPTMLMQGEDDTLFNLHEAIANYTELKAQGTPVKMVWQSWGHSDSTPAPGEYSGSLLNPNGSETVEGRMVIEWFNHYLKGAKAAPALDVSWFEPWVKYSGNDAAAAYASAPKYPIGTTEKMYLSDGSDGLVSSAAGVTTGASTFLTPPAGVPLSTTEISAESQTIPLFDTPGTFASYQSAPLTKTINVVGMPRVTVSISSVLSNSVDGIDPSGGLALFFKLEEITPSGTAILPDRLISPVRIEDFDAPVQVTLPGIVHQFPAGDSLKLIIAASDAAYRGTTIPVTVSVSTSPSHPGVLTLPVAKSGSYTPVVFAKVPSKRKHSR
jgi:ABC-2 type transport system ATP-binding protein